MERHPITLLLIASLVHLGPTVAVAASSSASGEVVTRAVLAGCRIDFGVTPDDSGMATSCAPATTLTTQYEHTQFIAFGTATSVAPPNLKPAVVATLDPSCNNECRAAGVPTFAADWTASFVRYGIPAGVNSFSADLCFIDNPGDAQVDLIGLDINGNVIDGAFTQAVGGAQTLTVTDPEGRKRITTVQVVASNDAAGLSVDCLNYDEPASITRAPSVSFVWLIFLAAALCGCGWAMLRSSGRANPRAG